MYRADKLEFLNKSVTLSTIRNKKLDKTIFY